MQQIILPALAQALHIDTVKRHLLIDHNLDDVLLNGLIAAAQRWVDDYCGTSVIQQGFRSTFDGFYDRCIRQGYQDIASRHLNTIQILPLPLLVVDSIKYLDSSGIEQTLSSADYRVNFNTGVISLAYNQCWPDTLPVSDSVSIEYKSGHLIPVTVNAAGNTLSTHDLLIAVDTQIFLETNHTMPGGISSSLVPYYVVNPVGTSFQISTTPGGAAVDFSDMGTGTLFVGYLSKSILHAMLLLIGDWYSNREDSIAERSVQFDKLPTGVTSLLSPYRVIRV